MGIENSFQQNIVSGPNTAGLAQRMYNVEALKPLYVLEKSYVLKCSVNQF
jgi:hypothetical protein